MSCWLKLSSILNLITNRTAPVFAKTEVVQVESQGIQEWTPEKVPLRHRLTQNNKIKTNTKNVINTSELTFNT